jgi:hypothetical protein
MMLSTEDIHCVGMLAPALRYYSHQFGAEKRLGVRAVRSQN